MEAQNTGFYWVGGVTFVRKSYFDSYDMCVDHPILFSKNGKKLNQYHIAKIVYVLIEALSK